MFSTVSSLQLHHEREEIIRASVQIRVGGACAFPGPRNYRRLAVGDGTQATLTGLPVSPGGEMTVRMGASTKAGPGPSYRFKALVKDEMTGKETEEMLLVLDLSVGKAQIVLIKPPLDAPSSSETTDVYIFGPETSVPGPGGAVGRGQKVSLRIVPVYMQRPTAKNGHNGAHGGQRAPSLPFLIQGS
ncbi:hypothetical protein Bbelb_163050 [Branchiostoma belcheri]|nr:hypothetical protein Bbelb_163050 [Branchiostoma belcheri]